MTRKIALLLLAITLPFAGCDKIPFLKKKAQAQPPPAPTVAASALAAAAPSAAPAAKQEPAPPPKPMVDPHAEVVVVCYHRIEGKVGGALSIEPALFEQQMQRIKDSGIPVIKMQDFLAWRRGEKNIPPKSIIITIDDGYVSGYNVGWPILKKFGYPFTMFVYLTYINTGGKAITWQQLGEMRDAGVDIGCHTILHSDLRFKPKKFTPGQASVKAVVDPMDYDTWLKYELDHSKEVIEEKLGIKCNTIAYPYGNNNEKVREAAKAAGYEAAFTTYGARLGMTTPAMGLGRYDVTTKDVHGVDSFTVGLSFKGMAAPGGDVAMAQEAAGSMVTEPLNGENITEPTPTIKANLETMGNLDDGTIAMRISGLGQVPAKFDAGSKLITYTPPAALKPGSYRVIISAKSNGRPVETAWSFTFYPDGNVPLAAPAATVATPEPKKKKK